MKNLYKNSHTEESISLVVQERVTCLREGLENIQHCAEVVMSFPGPACSTHLGVTTHASAWSFLQQVLQGSVFLELCQKKALIHILTTISKSNRAFSCCSLLFGWLQPINWSYIIYYIYYYFQHWWKECKEHRVSHCQKLRLGHHVYQVPMALFPLNLSNSLFNPFPLYISTMFSHTVWGCLTILVIVPYIIWSELWQRVKIHSLFAFAVVVIQLQSSQPKPSDTRPAEVRCRRDKNKYLGIYTNLRDIHKLELFSSKYRWVLCAFIWSGYTSLLTGELTTRHLEGFLQQLLLL